MKFKILIDKKESNNEHILKDFEKYKVPIEKTGLLLGDYAIQISTIVLPVVIKRMKDYQEFKNVFMDKKMDVNKNNSFFKDIKRAHKTGKEVILLVEDNFFMDRVFKDEKVRNKVIELETTYKNLRIVPISKNLTGKYIYLIAHFKAKNRFNN